ncbi:MAG: lipoyl(octanoyl) transferase LipB [Gammaproteobacteria bacterium]|nr:MAG: lipoyl(octanoyl) transferase LipB [Gammaproteobacteria bacterium]
MSSVPELPLIVRHLGCRAYADTFEAMKTITASRDASTPDEIWLLEHQPVFTQGQAGKQEYILMPGDIPVVQSDRGGHVTYHGPGQITGYLLIDLKRLGIGVRDLVTLIEEALVETLAHWGIHAAPRPDAPGVYVDNGAKIGSLGLRVRRGCSYHGLNFNVDMDLSPWSRINPCGLGVPMTQMNDLVDEPVTVREVADYLADILTSKLGYNEHRVEGDHPLLQPQQTSAP